MSRLEGRPTARCPKQLRLHPALEDLKWSGLIEEFNEAAQVKHQRVPVLVTNDGIIIAGFGFWKSALLDDLHEIHCIEYSLSEDEALQYILFHHRPNHGWNAFIRTCLALRLKPLFRRRALHNIRSGGKYKGSSNLTEAERVDVRSDVGSAAGVCVGNVSKVKSLLLNAHSEILLALRTSEVSIHRASTWMKYLPEEQRVRLRSHRSERGIRRAIRYLIASHDPKGLSVGAEAEAFLKKMSALSPHRLSEIGVFITKECGKAIFITQELARSLESRMDLALGNAENAQQT